ncbi:uncharacterized protein C9orf40-like [Pristis pectinata]|uniref:uncharacterized protein C9orf40-like n=1 Tax=Pristis pectinata TaxID=685728 RepID=UPI00223CBEAB|nr:uncharacterized protein C9orf40-like [Pristis pectinata]
MSKRKAEDILSCCPASKRFISLFVDCKSVDPLPSCGRSTKRGLYAAELDPSRLQPDCKRAGGARHGPSPWDRSTNGSPWVRGVEAQQRRDTRTSSGFTGSAPRAAPPPNVPWDEVSSQYNSFQFWRVPLPKIELAEIEDIGHMKMPEEMHCDIPEEAIEMEVELQN